MAPTRGRADVTLCGIVRDEGPYLLEWIAWYKLLGVSKIVIYDNQSTDQSPQLLNALHRAGEVETRLWPDRAGEPPQLRAYQDAISRCESDWIALLDADEFLVIHDGSALPDLLARLPDDCSAVAFNQRFFG